MLSRKKAQTGGLITGLIFGVASLVIGVIIAFVIVSTLSNADLLSTSGVPGKSYTSQVQTNESGWINRSGYLLAGGNSTRSHFSITGIWNRTSGNTIVAANYTHSNGILTNATAAEFIPNFTQANGNEIGINYTYTFTSEVSLYKESADAIGANLTKGVDNVSSKIPTVLLVAAIVLILGVLGLLIGIWQKMRMGSGGI